MRENFTWEKKGVKERLDWGFGNLAWELNNPTSKLLHKLKYKSDHRLILVSDGRRAYTRPKKHRFQYQGAWAMEEGFAQLVKESWVSLDWCEGGAVFSERASQ